MSLVGFKAQNHPQQTREGARDDVDDRGTTWEVFNALHARFRFTLDVAAAPHNAKLPRYFTRDDDGLAQDWRGERVWCNPPYSDISQWVVKAWIERGMEQRDMCACTHTGEHHEGGCTYGYCECPAWREPRKAELIVMLLPANRTEQQWWQTWIEPYRRRGIVQVEFLAGRMRFDRPGAVIGPKGDRPPFGCCLVIWGQE